MTQTITKEDLFKALRTDLVDGCNLPEHNTGENINKSKRELKKIEDLRSRIDKKFPGKKVELTFLCSENDPVTSKGPFSIYFTEHTPPETVTVTWWPSGYINTLKIYDIEGVLYILHVDPWGIEGFWKITEF